MKGCSPEPWLPGTSSPVAQAPEGQAVLRPGVTAYAGGGRQGQPGVLVVADRATLGALTHFMPEIFKLLLSKRPIDCREKEGYDQVKPRCVSQYNF